jgi:hypothetical protein
MVLLANFRTTLAEATKRYRKLLWLCLLAAIAAICINLLSSEDGEPRPAQIPNPIAFSVSFQGYSNSPSGPRWAILTVTNRDFGNLCFAGPCTVELSGHTLDAPGTHWKTPNFIPPRTLWQDSRRDSTYSWRLENALLDIALHLEGSGTQRSLIKLVAGLPAPASHLHNERSCHRLGT